VKTFKYSPARVVEPDARRRFHEQGPRNYGVGAGTARVAGRHKLGAWRLAASCRGGGIATSFEDLDLRSRAAPPSAGPR
jgi:hypothetical protein